MRVEQIKKRIKELKTLLKHPHQSASVKQDIEREILRLETQFKNIKHSLFGEAFVRGQK